LESNLFISSYLTITIRLILLNKFQPHAKKYTHKM